MNQITKANQNREKKEINDCNRVLFKEKENTSIVTMLARACLTAGYSFLELVKKPVT